MENTKMETREKSPKKRVFAWGMNDTLKDLVNLFFYKFSI